ncbi:hypothetical protein WICPIJ_004455 [Wickerhamomyces pijperi]|uniref:NAD(P)H-hydrate epimerase n=1 Tax=Wickerhamomyces pijperi TaxID=599730 RepID=A0A9P8Q7X4_WICPI|nr:hypothetical protein WICPIJ_004455 [Wickerhamomyces pijperi]
MHPVKVLSAKLAAQVDVELMSTGGFSLDQLMELAGLSVAEATYKSFPTLKNVLIIAGPGNNGGDGLVAARHLKLWGYDPKIYYPKPSKNDIFKSLQTQLHNLNIEFISDLSQLSTFQLIIDGIFGFSFQTGEIREPFKSIIDQINQSPNTPLLSIDIPSGWDVDHGYVPGAIREPQVLVSLTAPKPVVNHLNLNKVQHYVGGRFIGTEFANKFGIDVFEYKGYDQVWHQHQRSQHYPTYYQTSSNLHWYYCVVVVVVAVAERRLLVAAAVVEEIGTGSFVAEVEVGSIAVVEVAGSTAVAAVEEVDRTAVVEEMRWKATC